MGFGYLAFPKEEKSSKPLEEGAEHSEGLQGCYSGIKLQVPKSD